MQLGKLKIYFPERSADRADGDRRQAGAQRYCRASGHRKITSFSFRALIVRIFFTRSSRSEIPTRACSNISGNERDESGIIYCLSRNSVDSLAADLRDEGFQALPYHAGLTRKTRDKHQELFLKDEAKIIVATIAFGMGIDKSNVRFVVHLDLPKNIESYYQETGRAGRDGLQSEALLFFSWGDVNKLKGFAEVEGNRATVGNNAQKAQSDGRVRRFENLPAQISAQLFFRRFGGRLRALRQLPHRRSNALTARLSRKRL